MPYKGYVGGSNYSIEITRNEQGKWEGEVISTFDAYRIVRAAGEGDAGWRQLRHARLGQNGKPLVMRLVIGDCVRLQLRDREEVMRVVSVNSAGRLTLAAIHEANVDKRNADKTDPYSYTYKNAAPLQQAMARRVSVSPMGELRDPGFQG